jgi:polyisoprenoid-binding protein YceI
MHAQGKGNGRGERWEIDPEHSELRFSLRHIVVSTIEGRFQSWGGEMLFDPDDVSRARIHVWVDVASIDTDSAERDAHVRSAEFLDTDRFPRAQFVATDVAPRAGGQATVTGRLQLHGTTRYVDLQVVSDRAWLDDLGRPRATYVVTGRIDRQVFGLHWNQDLDVGGIVVSDKVAIDARVEVVRTTHADFARAEPAGAEAAASDRAPA